MKRRSPRLKRDWAGLYVRTIRILRNGFGDIPAGTRFRVHHNHGGLSLKGDACPHCGLRPTISRVPETDVEIIEEA